MKRQTTKFPGVRFREHPTRKYGIRPDKYFSIRFQRQGKQVEEGLGWSSAGWTVERAAAVLGDLKRSNVVGEPVSLKEKRVKVQRENLTFGQFALETYFRLAEDNGKKSLNRERSLFKCWIKPIIGDKPLSRVSPLDLERIKKNMATAGRSPRSIHYCLALIRQVFNQAKKLSLFQGDNPVGKVKKPKVDNRRLRFLTHEESSQLLNELASQDPQLHDITLLSLHCGLRAGELINLTRSCIDLERGTLLLKDTKGGRNRTVYLTDQAVIMLAAREKNGGAGYVFQDRNGKKIVVQNLSCAFGKIIHKLGFNLGVTDPRDKVVFHTLRHTFASWLVENGTDLYTVKELMGHSTMAMTERYSHLSPDKLQTAIRKLDNAIRNRKSKKKIDSVSA